MRLLLKLKTSRKSHFATLFIFSITFLSCGNAITEMREHLLGKKYCTVTLTQPSPDLGTITASPEIPADGKVEKDTVITFTASPITDYEVNSWSGATVSESDVKKATLTIAGDVTVSAEILPKNFVKVTTLSEAFTTDKPVAVNSSDNPVYGIQDFWKGVLYPARNVQLSAYCIGETEVTYNQWKEVYNWADCCRRLYSSRR